MHTRLSPSPGPRAPQRQDRAIPQALSTVQAGTRNFRGPASERFHRNLGNCAIQELVDSRRIQTQLKIGSPNDACEREADRVANQVMRLPDRAPAESTLSTSSATPVIHRRARPCPGALPGSQAEFLIQSQSAGGEASASPPGFEGGLRAIQGGGSPLAESTRTFFEPRFGAEFSDVRVHSDAGAADLAARVNAKAFTLGRDLVFGSGQYAPETPGGKQLLAHELTHVVQQRQGQVSRTIQRVHTFTPGRPAHDHTPVGWATVQAGASSNCSPLSERGRIECVCATLSPINVMNAVLFVEMRGMTLATAHLNHYISGGGVDFNEDTHLTELINQDATVRTKFATAIAAAPTDHIPIWQGDYTVQDFRFAFGGIDRVDYEVDAAAGTVDIWFKDRYDFHPAGFGYANKGVGDSAPPGRITNCVHAAAVELKATGSAADFWMQGEATFPLSLFPAPSSTVTPGGDEL